MTRIFLLIFCYILNCALSKPTKWLMQGDMFTEDEAASRLIQLDSQRSDIPVSSKAEVYYEALPGKFISCVIAASAYQRGHVSVVEGGYGASKVRIRYMSENGESDIFFILIQAAKREPIIIEENVARSLRFDIVYEPLRNWTFAEIQNIRNETDTFSL